MNTYLPLGQNGEILNSTRGHIDPPWDQAIPAVIDTYRKHLGTEVRSIYIDGSVVRGTATPYESDLDTSCITHSDSNALDLGWVKEAQRTLESQFPFAAKIELHIYSLQEVFEKKHHARMILKTLARCVYGKSIQDQLPDAYPDEQLAWVITRNFGKFLDQAITRLKETNDPENIRNDCKWMSKRIVRAGFALIMPRIKQLTLDLDTSAKDFIHYYPEFKTEMNQALTWSKNPTSDKKATLTLFNTFGMRLKQELMKEILKNP